MAVSALEHAKVNLVTENSVGCPLDLVSDLPWAHSFVAVAAVTGYGEGCFTIVAGTAGLPFFHLRHGDVLVFAGDYLAVMAFLAGEFPFGDVCVVAEGYVSCPFDLEGDSPWLTFVAPDAVFLFLDTECLDS